MVRVRFAPSPTGSLHVGGARTALFNWLFARRERGVFILRIEDTDRERTVKGSAEELMEGLKWLGLSWDEGPGVGGAYGPYFQSERTALYRKAADRLLAQGQAYRCFCDREELRRKREAGAQGYDRACRHTDPADANSRADRGEPHAVRLKVPEGERLRFEDYLRGVIQILTRELEDIILLKSDGFPTYHLANVVDDAAMKITHVLRAEEWIPSAPYHLLLYRYLGERMPTMAHLPVILDPQGGKLSKRSGASSLRELREQGYLADAVFNYLCLVGWSPGGDRELFSREEAVGLFELHRVQKRGGIFDIGKLTWMNGLYIRKMEDGALLDEAAPFFQIEGVTDREAVKRALPMLKERAKTLAGMAQSAGYLFRDDYETDAGAKEKLSAPDAQGLLREYAARLTKVQPFGAKGAEEALRALADELGVKAGAIIHPVRAAVTGRSVGPSLFELLEFLGREKTVTRIKNAIGEGV